MIDPFAGQSFGELLRLPSAVGGETYARAPAVEIATKTIVRAMPREEEGRHGSAGAFRAAAGASVAASPAMNRSVRTRASSSETWRGGDFMK